MEPPERMSADVCSALSRLGMVERHNEAELEKLVNLLTSLVGGHLWGLTAFLD